MDDRDVDELHRIWELKEKGAISDDEYARLKARILGQKSDGSAAQPEPRPSSPVPPPMPSQEPAQNYRKMAGIGCFALVGLVFIIGIIGSNTQQAGNALGNQSSGTANATENASDVSSTEVGETDKSPWSYSEDEDKVRGGTTYYARTTSTNSISQEFPYDSDTTMSLTVRKSPAYGTDVILTISSGQMMCPSYEGCSGTVRFDNGPAQRVSFNGPADNSSDTIFVIGAKQFIARLKGAKKVTIEKTLYEAGNPQFEFDIHGLKWIH
jgi:hypothetical protein